jgi:hypothetical protein
LIFNHKGALRRKSSLVEGQAWLDREYKDKKVEVSELNINQKNLTSSLEIEN